MNYSTRALKSCTVKLKILVFLSFFFYTSNCFTQNANPSQKTSINVFLRALEGLTFNCYNVDDKIFTEDMIFSNPSKKAATVKKDFLLTKPTVITCGNVMVTPSGLKKYFSNILLLPGDSLVIKSTDSIPFVIYSFHYRGAANNLISVPNDIDIKSKIQNYSQGLDPNSSGYGKTLIKRIRSRYYTNEQKINKIFLEGKIDTLYAKYLHYYNLNLKYYSVCDITFNTTNFKQPLIDRKILDSCYDEMQQKFDSLHVISSETTLFTMIAYNAYRENKLTDDFWDYFTLVPKSISQSTHYKNQIFQAVNMFSKNKENNPFQLAKIIDKIKAAGLTTLPLDSVFAQMKKKYKTAADTSVAAQSNIVTAKGDTINYFSKITSMHGRFVFVDFWASWCIPCRNQIPILHKIKSNFSPDDIVFFSVSIDDDEKHTDWLKANSDENLNDDEYSFRLLKGKINPLLKKYDISAIPRYILYDRSGNILNLSFTTPDKNNFSNELKDVVNETKN